MFRTLHWRCSYIYIYFCTFHVLVSLVMLCLDFGVSKWRAQPQVKVCLQGSSETCSIAAGGGAMKG